MGPFARTQLRVRRSQTLYRGLDFDPSFATTGFDVAALTPRGRLLASLLFASQ